MIFIYILEGNNIFDVKGYQDLDPNSKYMT